MVRIVVFGGDGFIGRSLINVLSRYPENYIIAFDRFGGYKNGENHPFENIPNVEIVPGDFFNRTDVESILEADDIVFHLISSTTPASSNADPFIDIDTNIRSSVELFEICVEKKVQKVIYPSSGGTIYGDINSEKINETTAANPRSPYGIGKLTIEGYLRYFKYTQGLKYIVYRIANPYGAGQNIFGKQGVVPIFMHQYINNKPITIFGDGEMVRDYIYISDLVNAIVSTFQKNNKFDEYNIGSGQGKSVNEIVSAIENVVGNKLKKEHKLVPASYVEKSVLDNNRFIKEFGLEPKINLEEGIKLTWKYVRNVEK